MPVSSRGYFAFAKETTPYTARTRNATTSHSGATLPAYWSYPVEEVEFTPEKQFIDFSEIRGSRQAYTTLDGAFQPTAMIKGAVYPGAALGQFLYGAFGDARIIGENLTVPTYDYDPDTEGDQEYTDNTAAPEQAHEMLFSDGAFLPTFTLERSDGRDGSATIVEQLPGAKIESVQFTANFGEKVDMTVNFQAARKPVILTHPKVTKGVTDTNSTGEIIYPGQEYTPAQDITPLYFNRAAIRIDGSQAGTAGYLKTLNWEMTNTLTRQETLRAQIAADNYTITPSTDAYAIYEGGVECTLSGTAVFENLDLYNKMMSGATLYLELWLGSDTAADRRRDSPIYLPDDINYALYFKWPKLKVSRASVPFTAGEVIESDVEFKVIFDQGATIEPFSGGGAVSGVTGASMFAKMISRHPGVTASGVKRPSFY
jgi:hypothetical protein